MYLTEWMAQQEIPRKRCPKDRETHRRRCVFMNQTPAHPKMTQMVIDFTTWLS